MLTLAQPTRCAITEISYGKAFSGFSQDFTTGLIGLEADEAQGYRRYIQLKTEHPFTTIRDIYVSHNEAHNAVLRQRYSAYRHLDL